MQPYTLPLGNGVIMVYTAAEPLNKKLLVGGLKNNPRTQISYKTCSVVLVLILLRTISSPILPLLPFQRLAEM